MSEELDESIGEQGNGSGQLGSAERATGSEQAVDASLRPAVWQRKRSEQVFDCRIFQVRRDWSVSPRDGREHDFYIIEATDWVNIIPLTANDEVVMIEQYRHGSEEMTLEVPGGMVDEDESPRDAAIREMLEETGYISTDVVLLGRTRPNPATHNNWVYSLLARNVQFQTAPIFDSQEHTVVRLIPLANVPKLIADGTINHALVVVCFHWLSLYQSRLAPVG